MVGDSCWPEECLSVRNKHRNLDHTKKQDEFRKNHNLNLL